MNTGVITFRDFHGKPAIGSSRIRGDWVIKHWPGAELYVPGKKYDVEIFQKVYWDIHMKQSPAIKILDICDPDWTENPKVNEVIQYVDAITAPTQPFVDHFKNFTDKPVKVIPDRLDLEQYQKKKVHKGDAKSVVWFGYSHNAFVLEQTISTLQKMNLKLTVISNNFHLYIKEKLPKGFINFIQYDEETVNDDIIKNGDIVLLPPPPADDMGEMPYNWRFKSNNKTVNAWGLGMPVARNAEELEWFVPEKRRKEEAEEKWNHVKAKYNVKQSVVEYLDLIASL